MIDDPSLLVNTQTVAEPEFLTATVAAIKSTGVTLEFPGTDEAGDKVYKCIAGAPIKVGDRVVLIPDSGTYVVVGRLSGKPGGEWKIPELSSSATLASAITWINAITSALESLGMITR